MNYLMYVYTVIHNYYQIVIYYLTFHGRSIAFAVTSATIVDSKTAFMTKNGEPQPEINPKSRD